MNMQSSIMPRSLLRQVSVYKQQKAWVVFSGQADLPLLRLLRPGFRHCYVLINDGDHWISVDPLSCHTEVMVHHISPDFNLTQWLRARNLTVVPADINPQTRPAPWGVHSCVEAVKRILGIHDFFILTPYQLYCHLTRDANKALINSTTSALSPKAA